MKSPSALYKMVLRALKRMICRVITFATSGGMWGIVPCRTARNGSRNAPAFIHFHQRKGHCHQTAFCCCLLPDGQCLAARRTGANFALGIAVASIRSRQIHK